LTNPGTVVENTIANGLKNRMESFIMPKVVDLQDPKRLETL
jgi:hypothetical protein